MDSIEKADKKIDLTDMPIDPKKQQAKALKRK